MSVLEIRGGNDRRSMIKRYERKSKADAIRELVDLMHCNWRQVELLEKARDAALAELAALKGGREAVAHRKTWSPGVTGFSCLHCGKARAYHDMQTFCPTGPSFASGSFGAAPIAPPAQASAWVAEGWKLVPVEPTEEMAKAAGDLADSKWCYCLTKDNVRQLFTAMLAAAPTPGASHGKQ